MKDNILSLARTFDFVRLGKTKTPALPGAIYQTNKSLDHYCHTGKGTGNFQIGCSDRLLV